MHLRVCTQWLVHLHTQRWHSILQCDDPGKGSYSEREKKMLRSSNEIRRRTTSFAVTIIPSVGCPRCQVRLGNVDIQMPIMLSSCFFGMDVPRRIILLPRHPPLLVFASNVSFSPAGRLQWLGWSRKTYYFTVLENRWFVVVLDFRMHYGAVPVTFD